MSKERDMAPEADFDLDEDLFNFEEVDGSSSSADYDLDDIFASFEEAEQQAAEAAAEATAAAVAAAPVAPEPEAPLPSAATTPPTGPSPVLTPDAGTPPTPDPERSGSWPLRPSEPHLPPGAPTGGAVTVVPTSGFGGKGMVWALILIGSLNALVALVVVKSMLAMRGDLADVGNEVTDSTREVLEDVRRSVDTLSADPLPEVPPSPDEHPTFEAARQEIGEGRYLEARQRLYALLAIVDRFDPVTRAEVEARANYLLAEAVHLEAVRNLSEERR